MYQIRQHKSLFCGDLRARCTGTRSVSLVEHGEREARGYDENDAGAGREGHARVVGARRPWMQPPSRVANPIPSI